MLTFVVVLAHARSMYLITTCSTLNVLKVRSIAS